MSKSRKARTRRHRRDTRKVMKYGVSSKARHTLRSGRTGRVHTVKLQSRRKPEKPK